MKISRIFAENYKFPTEEAAIEYMESQLIKLNENSKIEEDYSGQIVIKSNSYEDDALNDFLATNEKLTVVARRAQIFSALSPLSTRSQSK